MKTPEIVDVALLEADDLFQMKALIIARSEHGWQLSGGITVQKDIRQYGSVYKTYYWATMVKVLSSED